MSGPSQPRKAVPPPTPSAVREGLLRVSILTELPALLREMGHDPAPLLKAAGVDAALLADPENTLPFRIVGNLLDLCVKRTGCAHFGLLLGQRGGIATLGRVGLVVENSPNAGSAIHNLIRYLHHHDQGAVPTLTVDGKTALFGYAIYEKGVVAADQVYAGAIAIALRIFQQLCGSDWRPSEVWLPFRRPQDVDPYKRFFRSPLRFDAELAALVFPAPWLRHPLRGADQDVRYRIEAQLVAGQQADFTVRARRAVRTMLGSGQLSETDLARHFGVSRRTLIRQLQQKGTSFHVLLREIREEVACLMLKDTDSTIEQVAASLGYAGSSPFTRAFKTWTGLPPGEWRKQHAAWPADTR